MSKFNPLSFSVPTMGGKQFWADELFFHRWRIQRNVFTGTCRLLDEKNYRRASGTFDECRAALAEIKHKRGLPPMQGKAVIVLHGLGRTRNAMTSMCDYLQEQGGYEVFNVTYPSTRYDIAEHARALARIIDNLEGIEEINFVAHSMGNIVIRHYLADLQKQKNKNGSSFAAADVLPEKRPKFHRFVMLAPPNHEAQMATFFADNFIFKTLMGQSGQQLGREWTEFESALAVPDFEFAIIAGGKNNEKGYNPLLPGDNDGVITLESTKLTRASDFIVAPALHTFIMDDARVQEFTLRFLQKGFFISAEQRNHLHQEP